MIAKGVKDEMVAGVKKLLPDIRDVLVFGGIGCASYGIYMLDPPYAFIFAGIMLFYIGIR